jgi:hypothetical protein
VYNILIEFSIPMNLVSLIKMYLNDTCNRVGVGKHLTGVFPIRNRLKQGDILRPMIFNLPTEYSISRVQVIQNGLKINGTHQLLVYSADVINWSEGYTILW